MVVLIAPEIFPLEESSKHMTSITSVFALLSVLDHILSVFSRSHRNPRGVFLLKRVFLVIFMALTIW